ncbi:hypothetical protein D3C81_163330 [compost metagenome]
MKRIKMFVLPALLLLILSLTGGTSSLGSQAVAQSGGEEQHITVYIHSLKSSGDGTLLTADEINWYQGEEANRVFAEREPESYAELGGTPDDYYIVNDSNALTQYPIAPNATVTMQIYDHTGNPGDLDIKWNEPVTLDAFLKAFAKTDVIDLSSFPYHLTIENGEITSIVQQYIP